MGKYESTYPPLYTKKQKKLEQSFYIEDKKQRLAFLRNVDTEETKSPQSISDSGSIVCSSNKKYANKETGFRYGDLFDCTVRTLIVEILLEDIFCKAKELKTKQKKSFYLIEQRYIYRKELFDTEVENNAFEYEYNQYIADKIQDELYKINSTATSESKEYYNATSEDIGEKTLNIPLLWAKDKNIIGTIFGLLYDSKIITGSKTNLAKMLSNSFSNLSESSLIKVLGNHKNQNETFYRDAETVAELKAFIEWLISQKDNKDI